MAQVTKSDLVDIECMLKVERPLAILVNVVVGKKEVEAWLPRSAVEIQYTGKAYRGKAFAVVTMPEWLATEKELV